MSLLCADIFATPFNRFAGDFALDLRKVHK